MPFPAQVSPAQVSPRTSVSRMARRRFSPPCDRATGRKSPCPTEPPPLRTPPRDRVVRVGAGAAEDLHDNRSMRARCRTNMPPLEQPAGVDRQASACINVVACDHCTQTSVTIDSCRATTRPLSGGGCRLRVELRPSAPKPVQRLLALSKRCNIDHPPDTTRARFDLTQIARPCRGAILL